MYITYISHIADIIFLYSEQNYFIDCQETKHAVRKYILSYIRNELYYVDPVSI